MFDMRPLMDAVQAALQGGLPGIRSSDIYKTAHEGHVPNGVRMPCVGVKDGAIKRREKGGDVIAATPLVKVVVYAPLGKIGQESDEVLGLAKAVHDVLDDNDLGLSGVLNAFSPAEEEVGWFSDFDGGVLLRKVITYEYETEEVRP